MTHVDGYICCVRSKNEQLKKLVQEITQSSRLPRIRHDSALIVSGPGGGKSFLARRLADTLGFHLLVFNITQMLSRSDILDAFDTISTSQIQNGTREIMVFFDEINARLENHSVYDAFLAPLEEGFYIRGGKRFVIKPCVWLLAGTDFPGGGSNMPHSADDKASDLRSRLTLGQFELNVKGEDFEMQRLERVYSCVSLLLSAYPDARRVSEKTIHAFGLLPRKTTFREMVHFVAKFSNIKYGQVMSANAPKEWLAAEVEKSQFRDWSVEPEGDFVDIER